MAPRFDNSILTDLQRHDVARVLAASGMIVSIVAFVPDRLSPHQLLAVRAASVQDEGTILRIRRPVIRLRLDNV